MTPFLTCYTTRMHTVPITIMELQRGGVAANAKMITTQRSYCGIQVATPLEIIISTAEKNPRPPLLSPGFGTPAREESEKISEKALKQTTMKSG